MKILDVDDEDINDLIEKGGLNPNTLKRRKYFLDAFKKFVADKEMDYENVLQDEDVLERLFIKFLEGYRVPDKKDKSKLVRPKDTYFNFIKSNLTIALEDASGFKFGDSR